MSYLNSLRLHFAGKFQAAVSTVNNDPLHFNNAEFKPEYQSRETGTPGTEDFKPNGRFNPRGDASWRLLGCKITAAWVGPGEPATRSDPVFECLIADFDRDVPAKLVDLDPEQQVAAIIWGMDVRIVKADGTTLLRGKYEPAPLIDVWTRRSDHALDESLSAMYQSVLANLQWGDVSDSPFLSRLQRAADEDGLLSMKFNVDSFNIDFHSEDFMRGRIVGTIGPAMAAEPRHFVLGRHFMPDPPLVWPMVPAGQINVGVATVDRLARKIYLDLGNSLPTRLSHGSEGTWDPLVDLGVLKLVCREVATDKNGRPKVGPDGKPIIDERAFGEIKSEDYVGSNWYAETTGVVEFPSGTKLLTDHEITTLESFELAVTGPGTVGVVESPRGLFVRADQFVFTLSPDEQVDTEVYATRFGERYAHARIINVFDPSQLQPSSLLGPAPKVAVPEDAITFPARLTTDRNGVATLPIQASDPGNPRGFIDGQLYGIRPVLEETIANAQAFPFNPWDVISLHVFSGFKPDSPVTWYGCLEPIFKQYANLYPVMDRFLDMGDYDSVCRNLEMLRYAFRLDLDDPNSMPVTRDLSPAKRAVILDWLANEKPPKGIPRQGPLADAAPVVYDQALVDIAPSLAEAASPSEGGKAAAARRRIAVGEFYATRRIRS